MKPVETTKEIKMCPFCGRAASSFINDFMNVDKFYINCFTCNSRSHLYDSEDEAIAAWNERKDCNCDELSYFENGVELATNILERHKNTAEKLGGKDCAAYHILGAIIEEIEVQLDHAVNP